MDQRIIALTSISLNSTAAVTFFFLQSIKDFFTQLFALCLVQGILTIWTGYKDSTKLFHSGAKILSSTPVGQSRPSKLCKTLMAPILNRGEAAVIKKKRKDGRAEHYYQDL